MSQYLDPRRFFRWLKVDHARASRWRERKLFAPLTDELEARRLLALNVWIDETNFVQIAADDDLMQYIELAYDTNTSTYTVKSFNSQSNYLIVSDTSVGLTVTKTDYAGSGNPATLTIVQGIELVSQFEIVTGDSLDTVVVGESLASVFVSTGGGTDEIVQSVGLVSTYLHADGGSGQDTLSTVYAFGANLDITQSIYGNSIASDLAIDTSAGAGVPTNSIRVRADDVESVQNSVTSAGSNLDLTINGIGGLANGGFLDRTALRSLGITPLVGDRTIDLFGYETRDDIEIFEGNDGTNIFVGITGDSVPDIDIYAMNPARGLLRLRTLGGDDIVKAASGTELLTRISVDGGSGADFLSADATLIGGSGNDTLQGGLGNDSLVGDEGDDLFLISPGTDTVDGGAGFDILKLAGVTGASNHIGIDQSTGLPARIQVNATITTVDQVSVDQISVQGSTGADSLYVTGNSLTPVPIFATLDLGNDSADTDQASVAQRTDAYGEGGEDYFNSGPGTDYFHGGDDYDLFDAMYASRDSFDRFDGGSGFNDLYVEGSAFGNNVVSAIASGFRVSNTNGTGFTTAVNIGLVSVDSAGSGVILNASNEDNLIRTFDSTSDIDPPPALNDLVVTGMPSNIRVIGIEISSFVEIHGQGGGDTFESLGNSDIRVDFFGESGNDRIVVGEESRLAYFTGGDGIDSVEVTATLGSDTVLVASSVAGEAVTVNGVTQVEIVAAERLSVDLLEGQDNIMLYSIGTNTGLIDYELLGGTGNDRIDLSAFTALGGSVFEIWGGAGDDTILGLLDGDATMIARGGSGNDFVGSNIRAELYGDEGNDELVGSPLNDSLLSGGAGDDSLFGGKGFDNLSGDADQDTFFWLSGDGDDRIDGGTGEDRLIAEGNGAAANDFTLRPRTLDIALFDMIIAGSTVFGGEVEEIRMVGGTSTDTFKIGNLDTTSITLVDIALGNDVVADSVSVLGSTANDFVIISGTDTTLIDGLPWLVRVAGAAFSATTLVDGIMFDGQLGVDTIISSANLTNPVLVTILSGAGGDDIRINSPALGDNADRVTIDVSADVYPDVIQLRNGRNRVLGGDLDVILVSGSENDDTIDVLPAAGRIDISVSPPGLVSSNDLTSFTGVVHIEGLGGNDFINALAGIRGTVWGGDGNDRIAVGPLGSLVHGGSGLDQIFGGIGNDTLHGGDGDDVLIGDAGNDMLYGDDGSDRFFWFTGDGDDQLDGGTGDDRLVFTADGMSDRNVTLTPATSSTPTTANGIGMGNANMILAAIVGNGSVTGGSIESVMLEGGDGCDLFGIGNLQTTDVRVVDVEINNPDGHAVVSTYATNLPDVITVTADAPNQIGVNGLAVPVRIFGAVADATAIVVHAGFGGDTIEMDPQAEAQAIIVIDGGSGADTITGGSIIIGGPGNNTLIGSDGPNTIVGGTGSDTIHGLGADDALFGDAEVLNIDMLAPNCEYIGNLIILPTATGAPDSIIGGDGDDFVNGNIDADSIHGGEGHDDIGALTYNGIFFPEPGNDLIDAGEGDNCVFSGEGNDSVTAGNGNNRIVLGEGNDSATTGNGNNSIFGGAGNDTVTTGSGNDLAALGAGDDNATLGSGNDIAWGEDGNDFIIGQFGDDSLYGGAGDDILWGGPQATPPLKRGQKHAPTTPFDGNDVLAGDNGFDRLDGGNGDNIMDAGADDIRETMIGSGGRDTAYIHKDEGKFQDVLKNHSKRYTLIPYGAMPIPVVPNTPTDCDTPILVNVPNPLAAALNSPPKKQAVPKSTVTRSLHGR